MFLEAAFAHAATTLFKQEDKAFFEVGGYCEIPREKKAMQVKEVREFIVRHESFVYDMYADSSGRLHCRAVDKDVLTESLCEERLGKERR